MLEFYKAFYSGQFKQKAKNLADELTQILAAEQIDVQCGQPCKLPNEFSELLDAMLFEQLNDLFGTIRSNVAAKPFLRGYLPESRKEPAPELLFADCFSGAGGLSQGLINAGFQPAFVNDTSASALETYYFNHQLPLERFYCGDITKLVADFSAYATFFDHVKILAGGPPCQGFSKANQWNFEVEEETQKKRFIDDPRNELYKQFVQLIGLTKPDFFIIENVSGMKNVEGQIKQDVQEVTDNQYHFAPLTINASRFGVPQSRSRYILIGGKDLLFLEQVKLALGKLRKKDVKFFLKDALFGLPEIGTNPVKLKPDADSDIHGYTVRKYQTEQNEFLRSINGENAGDYLLNHKSRYNNDNDLEIFRLLPEGANSLDESIQHILRYKNRKDIFKDKYYKLKRDEVSKTITSHMKYDCHMYIHPEQPRGLSPREAARIQTFPDDYMFRGSLNDWYRQIGNAVPVKLAEAIGRELIKFYQ